MFGTMDPSESRCSHVFVTEKCFGADKPIPPPLTQADIENLSTELAEPVPIKAQPKNSHSIPSGSAEF